jgi:FkbM family methyltransferase
MIRQIHHLLVSNPLTRRLQRAVVKQAKSALSVPDAYDDLGRLIRQHRPECFLDIGSHVGATIARVLETHQVPIHGFEPTPKSFEALQKRFGEEQRVSIHNIALSNQTGTMEFFFNNNEQTNSLLDNAKGNNESLANHTSHTGKTAVKTMRLDDWIAETGINDSIIIKSDVQGAEGLLLEGGTDTFKNKVSAFYSEAQIAPMYEGQIDFFEMNKRLTEELGFVLHNIYPCYQDASGRALQTDALWIKESSLVSN